MKIEYIRFHRNLFTGLWACESRVWEHGLASFAALYPARREVGWRVTSIGGGYYAPALREKKKKK